MGSYTDNQIGEVMISLQLLHRKTRKDRGIVFVLLPVSRGRIDVFPSPLAEGNSSFYGLRLEKNYLSFSEIPYKTVPV